MNAKHKFRQWLKIVFIGTGTPDARLTSALETQGFKTEASDNFERDTSKDSDTGAYILAITEDNRGQVLSFADALRVGGSTVPVWLLADDYDLSGLRDFDRLGRAEGFIYLGRQTPSYYAKQVVRSLENYGATLLPPFFGRILDYDRDSNIAFDCPGHQGGQFYAKSPAGRIFFEHFGENLFRNDLCNADVTLGDLLIHEGPALLAQKNAARVFGADKTYFVLNGTSTSNKVVTNALLKPGDLVLFDRNNHKSNHHGALIQAGATPIYIPTARNPFGMVGAMDWDALDEDTLRRRIRDNPRVKDTGTADAERPFRLAVIQLATYDGTVYNARMLLEKIGRLCDYVLWDEAWIGYNAFHPLFKEHSPMRLDTPGPDMPGLFSTQSVHKQLAGFSQASQIHKRDSHLKGQDRYVNHKRFNEAFLLHASTSPFYPLFASLDVNAQIHSGENGLALWDSCIGLGIETRKKFRQAGRHFAEHGHSPEERWFFDPFVPDRITVTGSSHTADITDTPWEDIDTEILKREQQCWTFDPSASWHGYKGYAPGYAMVDPNKLTLLTPGIDRRTGDYLDFGLPATVVANYLRENNIVPEKCDLNSILFLLTPAEDESKMNTLIARLLHFKELWDRDAPMSEVLPGVSAAHSDRYRGYSIRQICQEMHDFYRQADIKRLQQLCFREESFPEQAMSASDAYHALVANRVDYIPLDQVKGRVAATLALIYPPGIGVIVPGERWDDRAQPMLDYFEAFNRSFNLFPGFNYEVQGVYQEPSEEGVKFHTYVVRES